MSAAPFSPKRSSSLAFRRNQRASLLHGTDGGSPNTTSPSTFQPNIGRKRMVTSPLVHETTPSAHVAHIQKVFQAAKATLHRDMFAASSPASSIESRMNLDQASPLQTPNDLASRIRNQHADTDKEWRYSTAPENLAADSIDVREPLPSPTLPDPPEYGEFQHGQEGMFEPVSSGFTSPNLMQSIYGMHEAIATALPASRSLSEDEYQNGEWREASGATCGSDLVDPMTQLNVSIGETEDDSSEQSPLVSLLKRRSGGTSMEQARDSSPEREIYLSPSAEAAANSAKSKRKLLKEQNDHGVEELGNDPELLSPDRAARRFSSMTPCPDPSVHETSPTMMRRPISALTPDMLVPRRLMQPVPAYVPPRATATGSPMPFVRPRHRAAPAQHYTQAMLQDRGNQIVDEHFSPGWYYAEEPRHPAARPEYTFSTAAAKIVGSNQAPESRIRDSYKTDTLTSLAKPPTRYRKNGIAAEIAPRGVGRYYQRPPSSLRPPSSARTRPDSRQTYHSGSDVRFRSSPPRGHGPDTYVPVRRKRAMDDSFIVAEDHIEPQIRVQGSEELMQVDDQTKAAVRMSIFGTNTPEALHSARRGITELSPNIQVFRKGTQEHSHLRKKRRPSYWDNDLKEIRESPAGRGGVNSPVSAQASMRADFEIASMGNTEMEIDEDNLSGEVSRAGMDLENRVSVFSQKSTNVPSMD